MMFGHPSGNGPTTEQMKAWARHQMRVCPLCSRKYIAPRVGAGPSGGYYRSDRKRRDICWRCERAAEQTKQ